MNNFTISTRSKKTVYIVYIGGELDAHTAFQLENTLKDLIEKEITEIVVNFSELSYIASAGLGVFMAYIEEVREKGGDIKLTNMSDKVYNVFDLLGFPALYEILEDEADAITRFSKA